MTRDVTAEDLAALGAWEPCDGCTCCNRLECQAEEFRPPGYWGCDHEHCACWAG